MTEQRFSTGFRKEPSDEPGLVLTNEGEVEVVRADGSRGSIPAVIPTLVSAPFPGANADTEVDQPIMVVPFDAIVTGAAYVPSADENYGDGPLDARAWEIYNATQDNQLAEATYDGTQFVDDGGVMAGLVAYPLNVLNDEDQLVVASGDVLVGKSVNTGGDQSPADPGGLFLVSFLVSTVSFEGS